MLSGAERYILGFLQYDMGIQALFVVRWRFKCSLLGADIFWREIDQNEATVSFGKSNMDTLEKNAEIDVVRVRTQVAGVNIVMEFVVHLFFSDVDRLSFIYIYPNSE